MPARASRGQRASQVARQSPRFAAEAKGLGARVRELREARGWTLERAAEETTVDWKHWQKIEKGQINLTLATLLRIAEGFGVSLAELFVPAKLKAKSK